MATDTPVYVAAQVVVELPTVAVRSPDKDDLYIAAVKTEFPFLVSHQRLPPEAPPQTPYLILQSTASRLSVSTVGARLDVRFYGDFQHDFTSCRSYLERKCASILQGWSAVESVPALLGIVLIENFQFDLGADPVKHLVETQLRHPVDVAAVQELNVRVGLKVDRQYFVNLTASNYENRLLNRPVFGGTQLIAAKPWEGELEDHGIQVVIDINNRLGAIENHRDPVVGADTVYDILSLLDRVVEGVSPEYVRSGDIRSEVLAR